MRLGRIKPWLILSLVAICSFSTTAAPSVKQRLKNSELLVRGAVDIREIEPFLTEFRRRNPNIELTYIESSTIELYQGVVSGDFSDADVIASSAMDLQVKLINDGYAQPYVSLETQSLPKRAKWRDEIFAFTYEPAVIAYNHKLLKRIAHEDDLELETRADMLEFIREHSDNMDGLIGTFDIDSVGVGYLLWSYDSQQTASYGRILESFGVHNVRLYSSSKDMLESLNRGDIAFAYNVLGTYANSATHKNPDVKLLLPTDYTTAIMRTAFINKDANNPYAARRYIDFLLSMSGQQLLADTSSLSPIRTKVVANKSDTFFFQQEHGPIRSIPLGLRLLVMTDELKREVLIDEWKSALIHPDSLDH